MSILIGICISSNIGHLNLTSAHCTCPFEVTRYPSKCLSRFVYFSVFTYVLLFYKEYYASLDFPYANGKPGCYCRTNRCNNILIRCNFTNPV